MNIKTIITLLMTSVGFMWPTVTFAESSRIDYDIDDNGLIEINDLDDLNAMRDWVYDKAYIYGSQLYGESIGCPTSGCLGFELTQNLDFDTNDDGVMDENDAYWNNGEGWLPIGGKLDPFNVRFFGNGHVIYNLYINRPSTSHVGLFGYATGVTVSNLGFTGPLMSVTGLDYVGALAGSLSSSNVTGLFNTGHINGHDRVGGLAGHAVYTTINNAFNTGTIAGNQYVGGLVGWLYTEGVINSAYATGRIVSTTNLKGALAGSGAILTSSTQLKNSFSALDSTGVTEIINNAQWSNARVFPSVVDLQCTSEAESGYSHKSCDGSTYLYDVWPVLEYTNSVGQTQLYWDFGDTNQLPGLNFNGVVYRDSDGDGSLDAQDDFPFDTDNDGLINALDAYPSDDDNDGLTDALDEHPLDFDNDGVVDDSDAFPANAAASVDANNNGQPDEWNAACDASCQDNSGLTLDVSNTSPPETDTETNATSGASNSSATAGSFGFTGLLLIGLLVMQRRVQLASKNP